MVLPAVPVICFCYSYFLVTSGVGILSCLHPCLHPCNILFDTAALSLMSYFNAATDFGMLRLLSDRWPRCSCGMWVERQHMFWHSLCRVGKYKVPSQKDFVINIWFWHCWFIRFCFFFILFENCAYFVQDKCVLVRTEIGDYGLMQLKQVYPE